MFGQIDYHYVFDSYDYLRIEKDKQQIVGKYCGKKTGKEVFLTGDQVSIIFHSDNVVEGAGFQLYFTAVPHGNWYFLWIYNVWSVVTMDYFRLIIILYGKLVQDEKDNSDRFLIGLKITIRIA